MNKVFVLILCLALFPALAVKAEERVAVASSAVETGVVEGDAVEGDAVEGDAVEGDAVEGDAVEGDAAAKMISGMSIVGNDEAPKALYIVPWKSSEIGVETSLNMMLTESALPVDREVFMRQLDFFAVSTAAPNTP